MALKVKSLDILDIRKQLLEEEDPIKRIVLALQCGQQDLVTATVLDSYASLSPIERLALAVQLFPILVEKYPSTPAIVLSQLSEGVGKVHSLHSKNTAI